MTHDDSSFGVWLARRRRALDLTQADLAAQVGCSVITIRKIEADLRTPSRQIAERLAECLAIAADERPAFMQLARGRPTLIQVAQAVPVPGPLQGNAPQGQESPLHTVPQPLTRLIGRDADVTALLEGINQGARLLTIMGPPGVGKTRLALHLAAQTEVHFADGAVFVPLAALTSAEQVLPAIADALRVAEQHTASPLDLLVRRLQPCEVLLVLDNVEHVLEVAPELAELLSRCPGLTLLATSQAPLRLRGERRHLLAPLTLPDPGSPPAEVLRSSAVMLFMERASEVAPSLVLDDTSATVVAAICTRLDGLPLALELVAAHCDMLAPQALLARLNQQLPLLAPSLRDLPARHRTLQSAIGWSYNLLQPAEQGLFSRLGVFIGGFDLDAILAVCEGGPEVEAALTALVHQSLVQAQPHPDGVTRYSMLETIRTCALAYLAPEALATARAAHAAYFATRMLAFGEGSSADDERELRRLTPDEHNLRAALDLLTERDPGEALRCATSLRRYWQARGLLREGRSRIESLLGSCDDDRVRIAALAALAALAFHQDDHAQAQTYSEASLALSQQLNNVAGAADALLTLGRTALQRAHYDKAERHLREALALWRQVGELIGSANTLRCLGVAAKDRGDLSAAEQLCRESEHLYRQTSDRRGLARTLYNHSTIAYWQGAYARSGALAEEAAVIFRAVDDPMGLAYALEGMGMAAYRRGLGEEARQALEKSLELFRANNVRSGAALVLHELGMIAAATGAVHEGILLQQESLELAWNLGDQRRAASCLEMLALTLTTRRPISAARLFGAASAIRQTYGAPALGADRERVEQCVATIQARIPAVFAVMWRVGERSPEAAVQAAIRQSGDNE
jgi:predicted ATPase/transcriptional regulator with XRE-family HTH domain